ncbi:TonB-dependent receptor [Sessilibacter sp. MAH1]
MKRKALSIAVKGAIALTSLSLLAGGNAYAQDEVIEEVTVTGSRLVRKDLESVSPVTIVNREAFQLSGNLNIEQKLSEFPSVTPAFGPSSNNPGNGTATVDLRGLGDFRTLVLVNGRRYIPASQNGVVDLNTIPASLIEQVEITTGGASAVYGSDAVAGVVNFTLRDDFEGVEISGLYDITEDGDGEKYNIDITIGGNFDEGRGNAVLYASFLDRSEVFQGDRSFSSVALQDRNGALVPGGSSRVPGTFLSNGPQVDPDGIPGNGDEFALGLFGENGVGLPFRNPEDLFNFAPDNYLQLPQERFLISTFATYDVNDKVEVYSELAFSQNEVPQQLAPTPAGTTVEINPDSPFFDSATQAALDGVRSDTNGDGVIDGDDNAVFFIARRLEENGPRISRDNRDAFRLLVGSRGELNDKWSYDAYFSRSSLTNTNVLLNDASASRFIQGIAVTDDGTECQNTSGGCVPVNIFGPGSLSQAAIDYINISASNITTIDSEIINASVNGYVGSLPWAENEVGLVFGYEHRLEDSSFNPDTFLASGDVLGFNAGEPTIGSFSVEEIFAEVSVPIIEGKPGIEELTFWAALRSSDYSTIGSTETYATSLTYTPIPQLTFRAGFQEAIRAPNVSELFSGFASGFPPADDPCSETGFDPDLTSVETCEATGVPVGQVSIIETGNTQEEGLFGGNPDLQEEQAESFTFGAVIKPTDGLDITIDYYNIEIEDSVGVFAGGVANILNLCYNILQDATSAECQAITRRTDGNIDFVTAPNDNIGVIETSGIDLSVNYVTDLGFGLFGNDSTLRLGFAGTYLDKFEIEPVAGGPTTNKCEGTFGVTCGEPRPEFKWTSTVTWTTGPLTLAAFLRYVDEVEDDRIANNGATASDLAVPTVKEEYYLDLSATYKASESFTTTFGIKNVLDTEPTRLGSSQSQANTFPETYDLLGPRFFLSGVYRFQ